jgi:hypothetical protein
LDKSCHEAVGGLEVFRISQLGRKVPGEAEGALQGAQGRKKNFGNGTIPGAAAYQGRAEKNGEEKERNESPGSRGQSSISSR